MAPIIRNTIQVTKIKGLKGIVYFEFNQSERQCINRTVTISKLTDNYLTTQGMHRGQL